jgi:hypothetical protein
MRTGANSTIPVVGSPCELRLEEKNILVIPEGGSLPPICIATGRTDNLVQQKRTEVWCPSWIALILLPTCLVIFFGLLVLLIIYFAVRKIGNIHIYLNREYIHKRMAIFLGNLGLFITIFTSGVLMLRYSEDNVLGVVLLLVSFLSPLIIYLIFMQTYTVHKIENGYIWLKFRKPEIAKAIYTAYQQYGA